MIHCIKILDLSRKVQVEYTRQAAATMTLCTPVFSVGLVEVSLSEKIGREIGSPSGSARMRKRKRGIPVRQRT